MTRKRIPIVALILGWLIAPMTGADVVYLKSGGRIEGRIVEATEQSVTVDLGGGQMRLARSSIERIEQGRSRLDDYDERVAVLADDDIDGWSELADWALGAGLATQSTNAWEHVLELDPSDAGANRALGNVQLDGRWVSEEEAYRARGWVRFEGRWMPPDERDAILQDRELRAATERARANSEARAREAEARAAEAEARAREAEAESEGVIYGVPYYWYGWGPPRPWHPGQRPLRPTPRPEPRAQGTDSSRR